MTRECLQYLYLLINSAKTESLNCSGGGWYVHGKRAPDIHKYVKEVEKELWPDESTNPVSR